MLYRTLTALLVLFATGVNAQALKTDTVKRGYYIPLDSNVMSCKIEITPAGKEIQLTTISGNKIPDSTISVISHLEAGSVVVYSELTVFNNGLLEKAPSKRYVIGSRSTQPAKRDPSIPDTLTAKEIGSIILDPRVHSFHVSWTNGGNYYDYAITGNGIFGEARTAIEALPSGTRVWIENIRFVDERNMPDEVHVVR